MNILFLFFFSSLFYIRSLKNFIFQRINVKQKFLEKYSGMDERYSPAGDLNITQVNTFSENLKKMYLLEILNSDRVSILTKMNIIKNISGNYNYNNNSAYEPNLHAGGLLGHFHLFILD